MPRMRSSATAVALVVAAVFFAAKQAFVPAPPTAPAVRFLGHASAAPPATQAEGSEGEDIPLGIFCAGGAAAALALSARRRWSSGAFRAAVAVKVEKTAKMIGERLQQAAKVSADIEKCMSDLKEKNRIMVGELEATTKKLQELESECDELKDKLGKADAIKAEPMQEASQLSEEVEKTVGQMQSKNTSIMSDLEETSAKVQSLEGEVAQLQGQQVGLIGLSVVLTLLLGLKVGKVW